MGVFQNALKFYRVIDNYMYVSYNTNNDCVKLNKVKLKGVLL